MKEIRLAWSILGRTDLFGQPIQHGRWLYADAQAREDLDFSAEVGNEAYGLDTHWVEEREAPILVRRSHRRQPFKWQG